jgi:hypothetical protein
MIIGVKLTETPPTELILAFSTLHKFAATTPHYHHLA